MDRPVSSPPPPTSVSPSAPRLQLVPSIVPDSEIFASTLFLNRELSWLEFNARVLAEADNETVPLLERLKFHAIVSANLDEFFMVRVAGLKQQRTGEVNEIPPDGMTVTEQLSEIERRVHELHQQQYHSLTTNLLPKLAAQGILIMKPEELPEEVLASLDKWFHEEVFPILTPIAIDPGHPFPHVRNRSLNLGIMFGREGATEPGFGVVQVPIMLPRLYEINGASLPGEIAVAHAYVLLEDLIARHAGTIFPGVRLKGVYSFRVTRNFDIEIDEEEANDLLQTIQQEIRKRERGNAVRLEFSGDPPQSSILKLSRALKLDSDKDVYACSGFLNLADLLHVVARDERRDLRDEPFAPQLLPKLRDAEDWFAVIRDGDILLQHPYDSFDPVVDFIARAADDPDVLAIKQTLYRAGRDSPIVKALARAADSGKQVTAIVELKARFDEESNIVGARTLEQAGVHVVYGLLGLKTHAKCLLIVRREKGKLRRYAHLSTGNYNPWTAKVYTDLGIITYRQDVCEDVSSLFNLLTGYSAPPKWNKLIVAPMGLHQSIIGMIDREADHARQGRPSGVVAKMNALVDGDVIEALYRASRAGVPITLLVRGICCLRPGILGISETIEVRAVVDRFLEHQRILKLVNGGKEELFLSSADWMPRNFHRRVELMLPVEDPAIRTRIDEILTIAMADNVKSWILRSDGSYVRTQQGEPPIRSQQRFIEIARDKAKEAEVSARTSTRFYLAPAGRPVALQSKGPGPLPRRRHRDTTKG